MHVIQVNNLSKSYKGTTALRQVSFNVPKGSVFGILGPNGSGKSTLLGLILGVLHSDAGSYSWFNQGNHADLRRRIGALLERPNFHPNMTALNNLKLIAMIRGVEESEIYTAMDIVDLGDKGEAKYKTFSYGMKQRLAIAATLIGNPEVLILDEPTNGLDPQGIADIRDLISKIAKEGTTIILASHMLSEIEKVCSHVMILKKGSKIIDTDLSDLQNSKDRVITITIDETDKFVEYVQQESMVSVHSSDTKIVKVNLSSDVQPKDFMKKVYDAGFEPSNFQVENMSLEQFYLKSVK